MKKIYLILSVTVLLIIIAGFILVNACSLGSGNRYRPKNNGLTTQAFEQKGARQYLGTAWKERKEGTIMLHLEGSPYEMGYQHGALLHEEIRNGVVPLFSDPIGHTLEYRKKPLWLRWLLTKYLEISIFSPIERATPRDYLEELKGIADGCGIPYREIFIANFKSDLTMIMAVRQIKARAGKLGALAECSSFAAAGPNTPDGELVFGRNTDYAGQGRWMRNQVLFFYKPRVGNAYVRVDTAGLIKCNTAMNEKGIVVGGHFMAYEGAKPQGVSFTVLENEIMRKASSIDEAIAIVRRAPVCGSFGLVVADGKNRKAVAIEAVDNVVGIVSMKDDYVRLTNCATSRELQPRDLMARYNLVMRDLYGRLSRLDALITQSRGHITPAKAAEFMGDHYDTVTKTERSTGIGVGAANNVTSAVFMPARGLFWVATGKEPACNNSYTGFDLATELAGGISNVDPPVLLGYKWQDTAHERGLYEYMQAFALFEQNPDDVQMILAHLDSATAADPGEPVYNEMAARLLIHAGRYTEALKRIKATFTLVQSPNELALHRLLAGQCLDLMGKHEEACSYYREVQSLGKAHGRDYLTGINDFLVGLSYALEKKPFGISDLSYVPIGFSQESGLE
jgi:tetratricopeptide (TPR) repeat protein